MSNDIELLLDEYGFLDDEGYLLPPSHPVIVESMERLGQLRGVADVNPADLTTDERLELQELHDLHKYYLSQLEEYEKAEYSGSQGLKGQELRNFLLSDNLADSDDDDDDYEDEEEEEDSYEDDDYDDDYED